MGIVPRSKFETGTILTPLELERETIPVRSESLPLSCKLSRVCGTNQEMTMSPPTYNPRTGRLCVCGDMVHSANTTNITTTRNMVLPRMYVVLPRLRKVTRLKLGWGTVPSRRGSPPFVKPVGSINGLKETHCNTVTVYIGKVIPGS